MSSVVSVLLSPPVKFKLSTLPFSSLICIGYDVSLASSMACDSSLCVITEAFSVKCPGMLGSVDDGEGDFEPILCRFSFGRSLPIHGRTVISPGYVSACPRDEKSFL